LYLLPDAAIADFFKAAFRLLKPQGRLLVKETEADGSWKHYKCLAQEWLMVKGLGRTLGSGGLRLLSADFLRRQLENAGFTDVRSESLHQGYTSPHILFEAAKP
jgi:2-polyprenyl-6-hydroxyphenyl methylase/3-demethylubiquinone-9 3-methyltransferase